MAGANMEMRKARWSLDDYRALTQPNEVFVHVSDRAAFDPVERLRWHEAFLRDGVAKHPVVKVLGGKEATVTANRQNTVFTAVHARYDVVASIVFPSLTAIDARTGQCLYDRACISLARFIRCLSGADEGAPDVLGNIKLPAAPSIYLTVLVHQVNHGVVDPLCQDVAIDRASGDVDNIITELTARLKSAEDRAFRSMAQYKQATDNPSAMHNPYHFGSLADILECATQRLPRQHSEGASVCAVIADFRKSSFLSGTAIMSVHERVLACDAQLVLIDVGSENLRLQNVHSLASCTHGVLADWAFMEYMGRTLGTTRQPELAAAGYFGNAPHARPPAGEGVYSVHSDGFLRVLFPVVLAGVVAALRASRLPFDIPSPAELSRRLRRAVLTKTINVLGKESNIGLPWPIDATSTEHRGSPDVMKQSSGRACVAKWTVNVQDPACLMETRVNEGWTVVCQWQQHPEAHLRSVQVAMPWMTGRNSRWLAATLVYEVSPAHSLEPRCDVTVWAYGPRRLVSEYDPSQGNRRKEEGSLNDVHRLHEFMEGLQTRDDLLTTMLSPSKELRSLVDLVNAHSTGDGCSAAWHMASRTYTYSVVLSDLAANAAASPGDAGSYYEYLDRADNRVFDINLFVQGVMQKWPGRESDSVDKGRARLGASLQPCIRRLPSGGVVVTQFIAPQSGEGHRLPLCLEVRVSFFTVPYARRKALLTDLKAVVSSMPASLRVQGVAVPNQRGYPRGGVSVGVAVVRDELAPVLQGIVNGATEEILLHCPHGDTSDTDTSLERERERFRASNPTLGGMPPASPPAGGGSGGGGGYATEIGKRHKMGVAPLSYQFTHRRWRWVLGDCRYSLTARIFAVLCHVRLKDGYMLLQSRDLQNDIVMYKGVMEAMVLYSVKALEDSIEVRVWVEQSDRGRRKAQAGVAFTASERMKIFEQMYLEHSTVIHSYATFGQLTTAIESPSLTATATTIAHSKVHMRSVTDHEHKLYEFQSASPWMCVRCDKYQAQTTVRWHCLECHPPLEYAICHPCMAESEVAAPMLLDSDRFSPQPTAPPTVPLWRRHVHPHADGHEDLHLPQIDLLLRGSSKLLIAFPTFGAEEKAEEAPVPAPADEAQLLATLSEPLVRLLDALQDSSGAGQGEVLSRARTVLAAPDTPTMKRAKAVLASDPWKIKGKGEACSVDLSGRSNGKQLRTQLIEAVRKDAAGGGATGGSGGGAKVEPKSSSLGGKDDDSRWTPENSGRQLYCRVLNCLKLLCPIQIDVSATDFPGNRYPEDLVPRHANTLVNASSLHCFVRPADTRSSRHTDPVTSVVIAVVATADSAKPYAAALDGEAKPTKCFIGAVNEVDLDSLTWDALAQQVQPAAEPAHARIPWEASDSAGAQEPPSGSSAFKKFMESSYKMMFAFGVYRMLQCGESVSPSDIKNAQSACVDYVTEVDVTGLASIFTEPASAVPHEAVNAALQCVLDKNFGPIAGTECHYFFRGHRSSFADTKNSGSHRQSLVNTTASSSRAQTVWPRVAPSIASSCAAPPAVASHRPGTELSLTAAAVAMIPSAATLMRAGGAADEDNVDGATSFPSTCSLHTSTEDDTTDLDSPRLGDGQSRLGGHSACDPAFDTESDGSEPEPPGSAAAEPGVRPGNSGQDEGDDLPVFLMMTVTYQVRVRARPSAWTRGKLVESVRTCVMPVNHSVLDGSPRVELPRISGTLLSATLSLVASSIPRQYFELSCSGFRPNRREAVRKCMLEVQAMDTPYRRFSCTRDAYVVMNEVTTGPQPVLEPMGDPYQFFPHRPKKLMERTMRRIMAEVHKTQLVSQLSSPLSCEPPHFLVSRIEALRPRHWSKATLRLLVCADPVKKPHLMLYFRDWLAESPELRVVSQFSESQGTEEGDMLVLTIVNSPAEDAAVAAALCVAACHVARHSPPPPEAPPAAETAVDTSAAQEEPLRYWLLLKLLQVKPVFRGPGGVHGLGIDRTVLKVRLWLFDPECLLPSEQQAVLAKVERRIRGVQMNLNRTLLLEDCYALSPHCISDLLVSPELQHAVKYTAVKAAIVVVAYSYAVLSGVESSARRRAPAAASATYASAVTPQPHNAAKIRQGKAPSVVMRPGSVAGESMQSFSLLVSSVKKLDKKDDALATGSLVSRDLVPYEPWERWGALGCTQHIVSEENLGLHTEPEDVDKCLFQVWTNWQCDNRTRTYLWRGKDEVYYFQFKLTEFIDYTPYRVVGLAGAAAALAASAAYEANAGARETLVSGVMGVAACVSLLAFAMPRLMQAPSVEGMTSSASEKNFMPLVDSFLSLPEGLPTNESGISSLTMANTPLYGEEGEFTSSLASMSPTETEAPKAALKKFAHDLERGRLRATMMIYSVRPPPEDIMVPLAQEFKGCMRSATVIALGKHLHLKTDGKLTLPDLVELQQRAERRHAYTAVVPQALIAHRSSILAYAHSHTKKWATKVRLTTDPLPGVPPPHFLFPPPARLVATSRAADTRHGTSQWLACLHVGLVRAKGSDGEAAPGEWGALAATEEADAEEAEWQPMSETEEEGLLSPDERVGLRFVIWVNGDNKELEPAVAQVRDAIQNCVVQVLCEASIERALPPIESFTAEDFDAIHAQCGRATGQYATWGTQRKRLHERQWESCHHRSHPGTIQPSSALTLVHDIVQLLRDLHAQMTNEPVRNKQTSLQPVAFYMDRAPVLEKISHTSPQSPPQPDAVAIDSVSAFARRGGKANGGGSGSGSEDGSAAAESSAAGDAQLIPVPDFTPQTMRQHSARHPVPARDYYVLCGRGDNGAVSEQWSALHNAQTQEDGKDTAAAAVGGASGAASDVLKYYDGEESAHRPCLFAVKVSNTGLELVAYNLKSDFLQGMQHGITHVVSEYQKRYALMGCILHQKMGLSMPGLAMCYPQEALLFREPGVGELTMTTIDDIFTSVPYTPSLLEQACKEANGTNKMAADRRGPPGVAGGRLGLTRRPSASTWGPSLAAAQVGAAAKQAPQATPISGLLFGVGGVSSRAAAAACATASPHVASGKLSSDLARHALTFKAAVASEQEAAQQLRARDAVCRDVKDFREAVRAQWPRERPGFILFCPRTRVPLPALLPGVAALSVLAVAAVTGPTLHKHVLRQQVLSAVAAAACVVVAANADLLPQRPKVDAKHLKVVTGRCVAESEQQGVSWPSYYTTRSRMRVFVANCIRMRQSSRLYHCQRVPFFLNEARKQLLIGQVAGTVDDVQREDVLGVDQADLDAWRALLARLMRSYMLCLTAESEKKMGGETWITAGVNPDALASPSDKKPTADDDRLKAYAANCAALEVGGACVAANAMTYISVTEASGGVLLMDLSVREACFSLEIYLFDAAAASSARRVVGPELATRNSPVASDVRSNPVKFHRTLAHLRSQLHMNSLFYDLQVGYMHEVLRAGADAPKHPVVDWLGVLEDAVLLYEHPPLYSANYVGCKRVTVSIPQEILNEIHAGDDERCLEFNTESRKKALGRFFAYVCKQAKNTLRGGDNRVALLMYDDSGSEYQCDGVAVGRLDSLDTECLSLPLDVYVIVRANEPSTSTSTSRETRVPPSHAFLDACYATFRDQVKRQCDDAVRNYRVHRLWKRLQQQKISVAEVNGLLGRVSDAGACAVSKREVVSLMDPSDLSCFQDIDPDMWARVCAACMARRRHNSSFLVYCPGQRESISAKVTTWDAATAAQASSATQQYVFIPPRNANFSVSTGAMTAPANPHCIIVECSKKATGIWWCSPSAQSEHIATLKASPELRGEDARFFTDWVNCITEAMWATEC